MSRRACAIGAILLAWTTPIHKSVACCPVTHDTRAVVNADQTVIMVWDAEKQTQHFIRQASFKSDADDVGFLVPTPSRPQLEESGDAAFSTLRAITAPPVRRGGMSFGCSAVDPAPAYRSSVRVIEEKRVAGFDATVLSAASGAELAAWLHEHGYSFSPEVADWAHPYVAGGWMMVALKVAKPAAGEATTGLRAAALRLSFQTERPLFPYREPESALAAKRLGAPDRLLRIYFIGDGRYRATEGRDAWSGRVVWSGDITSSRAGLLADLRLPSDTGPSRWWLTEFEDRWPYERASGDVFFSRDARQSRVEPAVDRDRGGYDVSLIACLGAVTCRRIRRLLAPRGECDA